MFRALATAAALGLAAFGATVTPAAAADVNHCVSVDVSCQGHQCSNGTLYSNGATSTGPWVTLCR